MTKVYSRIPPPPSNWKLQIWDDQSLLRNSPQMKNFRFKMTKIYSGIPPPMKNFRFEMTKVYSWIPPPQMKNFRFEMTKVYSGIPPQKWKTSDLRWPKFTPEYPPPPPQNEKLQIWEDQSLLWNTPPPIGLESGRSYVETNLYPPWIPLVGLLGRDSGWILVSLKIFLFQAILLCKSK